MQKLEIKGQLKRSDILIYAPGEKEVELPPAIPADRKVCCVYDSNLPEELLDRYWQRLRRLGYHLLTYPLKVSEEVKRLATVEHIAEYLSKEQLSREDLLVAMGGGVVGDLVGFTASCYMRGIDYWQLPTTLLAMVDSSIGGKTGVNLASAKNIIGAFHQASLVVIDSRWLDSLPLLQLEVAAGELLKYGLLDSEEFFTHVVERVQARDFSPSALFPIIERSVRLKVDVVNRDERERDYRRILNLGHTFAHSLESLGSYRLLFHGQAVHFGLLCAVLLSSRLGILPDDRSGKMLSGLLNAASELTLPLVSREELLAKIFRDKKLKQQQLNLVLLRDFGEPVVLPVDDHDLIFNVFQEARELWIKR